MKVIFSRKGFDSKYGGGCSPILPDGRLLSLPIPSISIENGISYSKLNSSFGSFKSIMQSLGLKIPENDLSHLDPDLDSSIYPRLDGWRGIFGQAGAASTHLINEKVEENDIFLFFGSFRNATLDNANKLCFSSNEIKHIIFGYLVVGEVFKVGKNDITSFKKEHPSYLWALYHPHLLNNKYGKQNTIYIAKKTFNDNPGYGSFYINNELVLTKPNSSKSIWKLPVFFHPNYGTKISRHSNESRFSIIENYLQLKTVGIGQEFVVSGNNQVYMWAEDIIKKSKKTY